MCFIPTEHVYMHHPRRWQQCGHPRFCEAWEVIPEQNSLASKGVVQKEGTCNAALFPLRSTVSNSPSQSLRPIWHTKNTVYCATATTASTTAQISSTRHPSQATPANTSLAGLPLCSHSTHKPSSKKICPRIRTCVSLSQPDTCRKPYPKESSVGCTLQQLWMAAVPCRDISWRGEPIHTPLRHTCGSRAPVLHPALLQLHA